MIGIELQQPVADLSLMAARQYAVLINVTRGRVIRLLPPLTLNFDEAETIVQALQRLLE